MTLIKQVPYQIAVHWDNKSKVNCLEVSIEMGPAGTSNQWAKKKLAIFYSEAVETFPNTPELFCT